MTHLRGEVEIEAPVEEVFDMVADERNEPRYNRRMARAEKVTEGPVGVGSRFVAEPKGMGSRGRMTVDVVACEPPHRVRTRIRSSYLDVEGTVTLAETAGGTRLAWDWDLSLTGPLRVLSPAIAVVGPRWERHNWVALKQYLEGRRT